MGHIKVATDDIERAITDEVTPLFGGDLTTTSAIYERPELLRL